MMRGKGRGRLGLHQRNVRYEPKMGLTMHRRCDIAVSVGVSRFFGKRAITDIYPYLRAYGDEFASPLHLDCSTPLRGRGGLL